MRTILITGIFIIFSSASIAQTKNDTIQQLQNQIEKLEKLNSKLSVQVNIANSNIKKLERNLQATADSMGVLKSEIALTNKNLKEIEDNLGLQIQQVANKSNTDIDNLRFTISRNTIYWIIAVFSIALVIAILYGWLKVRLQREKTEISDKIKNTGETLRKDFIKLDDQLFWLLESQMQFNKTDQQVAADHTLAIKVADEIIRIQKHLGSLDPEIKELKQVAFALERIQDNFKENGYEMVELLNKPYNKGMKVSAKFIVDNSLKHGEQIITRIIKPQINYKGHLIQEAQVEVSVGE